MAVFVVFDCYDDDDDDDDFDVEDEVVVAIVVVVVVFVADVDVFVATYFSCDSSQSGSSTMRLFRLYLSV